MGQPIRHLNSQSFLPRKSLSLTVLPSSDFIGPRPLVVAFIIERFRVLECVNDLRKWPGVPVIKLNRILTDRTGAKDGKDKQEEFNYGAAHVNPTYRGYICWDIIWTIMATRQRRAKIWRHETWSRVGFHRRQSAASTCTGVKLLAKHVAYTSTFDSTFAANRLKEFASE